MRSQALKAASRYHDEPLEMKVILIGVLIDGYTYVPPLSYVQFFSKTTLWGK